MIDLYTWTTPNGQKVSIMLEEVGFIPTNEMRRMDADPAPPSS